MNIGIWIAIALVSFVLPSVALTSGGKKTPEGTALAKHAASTGLPLTNAVVAPVIERIRRRERGMLFGGVAAIVAGLVVVILVEEAWAPLIVIVAGAGTALGGAWAAGFHTPARQATTAVVARPRTVELSDYLTPGERFGLWMAPVLLLVGAALGTMLLSRIEEGVRGSAIIVGLLGTAIAILTWAIAALAVRKLLNAPARSGSDLELAWDDAERAIGLRSLTTMAVAISCVVLALWGILMAQILTANGFYRAPETNELAVTLGLTTAIAFGALIITLAAGPVRAWITGTRLGYEQRKLWPNGW